MESLNRNSLFINTRYRNQGDSASNCSVLVKSGGMQNFSKAKVNSISFNKTFFNIRDGHNKISIDSVTQTITPGFYDLTTLATYFSTNYGLTLTLNSNQQTVLTKGVNFTLAAIAGDNFYEKVLGYTESKSGAATYTSTNLMNLNYDDCVYLYISLFKPSILSSKDTILNNLIPVAKYEYGTQIDYVNPSDHYEIFNRQNVTTRQIDIRLLDQDLNILELNGSDIIIDLDVEF